MKAKTLRKIIGGLVTGLCNGLFGAGGGMVAVLTLEKLCGLDAKEAHATAISVMLPLTAVSSAIYVAGSGVDWAALAYVLPALCAGSALGARLTGRIEEKKLRRVFAVVMLASGVWMLL